MPSDKCVVSQLRNRPTWLGGACDKAQFQMFLTLPVDVCSYTGATSPDSSGVCPSNLLRNVIGLCADDKGVGAYAANLDGSCANGGVPNLIGLCINTLAVGGTSPPLVSGACTFGTLNFQVRRSSLDIPLYCRLSPSRRLEACLNEDHGRRSASGTSPGCTAEEALSFMLLSLQGICVSPPAPAAGYSPGFAGSCTTGSTLNVWGMCVTSNVAGTFTPAAGGCSGGAVLNREAFCVSPG